MVVNHYEPTVKLILAALKNHQFKSSFGDTLREMIKDKVDALSAVLDMITELKLAIMKRRVKMLS